MSAVHPASKASTVHRTAGSLGQAVRALARRRESKFIVAGGLASTVNWVSRFPLALFWSFETAVALAYAVGMGVGFVLYRSWVFEGSRGRVWQQLPRFLLVNAFGLAAVMLSACMFLSLLAPTSWLSDGSTRALAHSLALIVGAAVNFLGHRSLTFAGKRAEGGVAAQHRA